MFQYISNLIVGSTANQAAGSANATAEGVENSSLRLTSVDAEDEWVLVGRQGRHDSEGNSEFSSVENLNDIDDDVGLDFYAVPSAPVPALLTRTSSTSSLPCTNIMEESWFLTPPPCFISTGPVHMETSPLENLLIEHPSMSVYTHHHRYTTRSNNISNISFIYQPEPIEEQPAPLTMDELIVAQQQLLDHAQRMYPSEQQERPQRHLMAHVRQELEIKRKEAQKVQIQRTAQWLKKAHMDRNNKAREVNSCSRRQRRADRAQGAPRTNANYNRKC